MMKKIVVTNFRGIISQTVDLDKINVITAPNGSGKSSFIDAINWFVTGKISDTDIRYGQKEASVEVEFDSGTILKRIRKVGKGSCTGNGNKITDIVFCEMLKNELKCSLDTATALCGTDFLAGLNKKDFAGFLLKILPITIRHESFKGIIEETLGKKLLSDEENYIFSYLTKDVYTLADITEIYNKMFAERKARKTNLADLKPKAEFDTTTLPQETKEQLEKALADIALKEATAKDYKNRLDNYTRSVNDYNRVIERKKQIDEELLKYKDVVKPTADIQQLEAEKKQFLDAIAKQTAQIEHNKEKIKELAATYRNLENPICPLTKECCKVDMTPYKEKIGAQGKEGEAIIKKCNEFINRCLEQVAMRDSAIKEFNDNNLLWTKKEALMNELQNLVVPTLPEKPVEIKIEDLTAQKDELNHKMKFYTSYETSKEYAKQMIEVNREVEILEKAVNLFDVKGIRSTLLKKGLKPVEALINKSASAIRPGFKITLVGDSGLDINIYPDGNIPVPIEKVSSGEFILVAYLIMGAIHDITGASFLIIDDMDRLDKNNALGFMKLLEADTRFTNVIIAGVDHEDFTSAVPTSANVVTL